MRGRPRGNSRFMKRRPDRRVIKKCPKCTKEIPVACKTCPKCKSHVRPSKAKPEPVGEEEEISLTRRRTERIRREQPKFFNPVEVTNRFKRGTKRKHSVSTSKEIKRASILTPSRSSLIPACQSVLRSEIISHSSETSRHRHDTSRQKSETSSHKPGTSSHKTDCTSIMKPNTLDLDGPKRRRGRPKSISAQDSDKEKTPSEEDWYGHLPPEKLMQYKIILAEINRKITTQTFNPVG